MNNKPCNYCGMYHSYSEQYCMDLLLPEKINMNIRVTKLEKDMILMEAVIEELKFGISEINHVIEDLREDIHRRAIRHDED